MSTFSHQWRDIDTDYRVEFITFDMMCPVFAAPSSDLLEISMAAMNSSRLLCDMGGSQKNGD